MRDLLTRAFQHSGEKVVAGTRGQFGGDEVWSDSGCFLKVESIGFADW